VIQLRDIMTTEVLTTSAERPVAEVTSMMVKARVGSAVVMQGSWLAGILTERDVLRAAASGSDLTKSPVSEWMTRNPITATANMTIGEAAEVMLTNGFRHLPIVEAANSKVWSASVTSWPLASAVARTSCRSWSGAVGADARRPAVRPRRSCIQRDHSNAGTAIHSPMGCGNAFSSSSELMEETAEKVTSTCPGLLIVADDGECSRWIRHRWPGRPVRTMTVAWSTSTRRTSVGWPGELHPRFPQIPA
jgi:CBS domain-containing protein